MAEQRLIDANMLKESIKQQCDFCSSMGIEELSEIFRKALFQEVDNAPTIEQHKKGTWIKTGQSFVFPEKFRNYSCSECGYDVDKTKYNFCPNCGANMRRRRV